jgi:hypothetical protein
MWRVYEVGEVRTWFWWGDLRERKHLEVVSVDGRIILKRIFKKLDGKAWTGLIRLRRETVDGLL